MWLILEDINEELFPVFKDKNKKLSFKIIEEDKNHGLPPSSWSSRALLAHAHTSVDGWSIHLVDSPW